LISYNQVKQLANKIGFDDCGIVRPQHLNDQIKHLKNWISNEFHGTMSYMEKNHEIRSDILKMYPECKSIVVVLLNYHQSDKEILETEVGKISSYALGHDYHFVLKEKLKSLLSELKKIDQLVDGKFFTDSAPIFERELARLSGLGWVGKNTMLISRKNGSFFFIGELLLNIEIEPDKPFENSYCGSCTACLDSCPTNAFSSAGILNATKCISYWTIEHKEAHKPDNLNLNGWIWGCDICQDVCPWNKTFSKQTTESLFQPRKEITEITVENINKFSENGFRKAFSFSPLIRRGKKGILRNIRWNTTIT